MMYQTVVADPPWQYRDKVNASNNHRVGFGGRRGADGYYPTMPVSDICALGADGALAGFQIESNAHLYLWFTNAFPKEALQVAEAWGFKPRTILTWVKPGIGMGSYYRNNTEHVLFCVRGSLRCFLKNQRTSFDAPRGRHSEKPERFFTMVESMSPGPYLELFARKPRLDWTVWGNEV